MDDDRYKKLIESINLTYQPTLDKIQAAIPKDYLRVSEIVNSSLALSMAPIQAELNRISLITSPIADIVNNYSLITKPLLDSALNTPGYQALLESLKNIPLQQVDWSDYFNENFDYDEYTPEIIEQLSENVEPVQIAQNMEDKTGVPLKTWLELITAILVIIGTVLGMSGSSPIEINIENFNINFNSEIYKSNESTNEIEQSDNEFYERTNEQEHM